MNPPHVRLRALTVADWPAVHEWARLPEACRYQAWGPNTPEQTRAFAEEAAAAWTADPPTRLVHVVEHDGAVVGSAELLLHDNRQGEIGYGVHPRLWGRGLATAVARRLLDLGFGTYGRHRIFATCDPRNVASARVLTKVGMTHEGRMRETMLIRDGWRDSDLYAILEQEWRS